MKRGAVVVVIVMMVAIAHPAGRENEAARWKRRRTTESVRWMKSDSGWRGGGAWRR